MRRWMTSFAAVALLATPCSALADDAQIAQSIISQLKEKQATGELHGFNLNVKVDRGDVWLEGRVSTPEQKALAIDIARHALNVVQVVDAVQVQPLADRSPAANRQGIATQAAESVATTRPPASALPATYQPAPQPQGAQRPIVIPRQPQSQPMQPQYTAPYAAQPIPTQPQYAPQRIAMQTPMPMGGQPQPAYIPGTGGGVAPARYDHPHMPGYAWPSYAAYPNYAAATYPKQHSAAAWPYIGPFYPYPQVPLGWRKVQLEWDDGWWMLDFKAK